MQKNKIGIVILATNSYFVLGITFIKKFIHHYKGNMDIKFYFFSDTDPTEYLPEHYDFNFYEQHHKNWTDGTNSKFKNIVNIQYDLINECEYVYYFDADTSVSKDFNEDWFIGDLVGGEHYGNRNFLSDGKGFDRNPIGKSYVPIESNLPYTYRYGAFFGGKTHNIINFCETLRNYQIIDQDKGYEPPVNDESYINAYFHFNPPTYTVPSDEFMFDISHKGGIGETRNTKLDISDLKRQMLLHRNDVYNILNGELVT
jgi:hypothetical protein